MTPIPEGIKKERTPSETLIAALEDFGESEPQMCVIIWTSDNGDINWSTSTRNRSPIVGMLETVKHLILKRMEDDHA
jgi:hypothetical protein